MISVKNAPRLKRNRLIAHIGSIGGLVLLLGGVLIPLFVSSLASLAGILMIVGLFVSLIGIYVANRWVKKPRPETIIDQEFKGFTDKYRVYHYPNLPYDHVLLNPGGATLIQTVNLEGAFTYRDGKWSERINLGRALRYIVEEHLGNPIRDARDGAVNLAGHLYEVTGKKIPVDCLVVFIHPRAILDVQKSSIPVVTTKKLRSSINVKSERLPDDIYEKIMEYLDQKTLG
jgi:hypothetical protein